MGNRAIAAVLLAGTVMGAHAGEVERLREENARLERRVRELEAENAALRGAAPAGDRGLLAALQERASEAVVVSPGAAPGASRVATEPSRLEGLGGGKGRHWIIWRGERPASGGRAESVSVVIDSVDSRGAYRKLSAIAFEVDGAPVDLPVTGHRMQVVTTGRDTGARQRGESVTARVPADLLGRMAAAGTVSGRLGSTTFRLTPQQLADLREFVKRLGG